MAIDSTLFMADIPAGTYAVGDKLTLDVKAGPSVVRSGRGAAIMKRFTVGVVGNASGSQTVWKISLKNSDWIDKITSVTPNLTSTTSLDERNGGVQRGNDCPLTPNSSWECEAECVLGNTTTVGNTVFGLLDIDYPSVSSIVDPDNIPGIPTSIEYTNPNSITLNALGTSTAAAWDEVNVDIFKAGYEYALQKVEIIAGPTSLGFMALANAANMAGLQRIIPITSSPEAIRNKIEYATKLVKGPMDIKYLLFANSGTGTTTTINAIMDFVKRKV